MADAIDERDVFTAVYRDMAEREVVGWQNHGKPLLADDGRDWLQEAYEEALDMAVYLKARILERALTPSPSPDAAGEGSARPADGLWRDLDGEQAVGRTPRGTWPWWWPR